MKTVILIIPFLLFGHSLFSQKDSTGYPKKVKSIDAIIEALYDVISGEAGEERDWDLLKYLFKDDAKMIPSGEAKDGSYRLRYDTPDDYIEQSGTWLIENGFFEHEIHRETQQFGNIAHIFSTYECFKKAKDKKSFMRGINSIQLIFDGNRWWIVNIYWSQESGTNPIPEEFLPE